MNTLNSFVMKSPVGKDEECAQLVIDTPTNGLSLHSTTMVGQEYTFSCWVKSEAAGSISVYDTVFETSPEWTRYIATFTADNTHFSIMFGVAGTYYVYHAQLERGNKATDWTPAPEDVDQSIIDTANATEQKLQIQIDKFNTYFDFSDALTIGKHDSPYKVRIAHDKYSMMEENRDVMFIQNGEVRTPRTTIMTALNALGYMLTTDENGVVSCDWAGVPVYIEYISWDSSIIDYSDEINESGYAVKELTIRAPGDQVETWWEIAEDNGTGELEWEYLRHHDHALGGRVGCDIIPDPVEEQWPEETTCKLTLRDYGSYVIRCTTRDRSGNTAISEIARVQATAPVLAIIDTSWDSQPVDYSSQMADYDWYMHNLYIQATGVALSYTWQIAEDNGTNAFDWQTVEDQTDIPGAGYIYVYNQTYSSDFGFETMFYGAWVFRCIVTDKYGNEVVSEISRMFATKEE